jgi:hypothetical protein
VAGATATFCFWASPSAPPVSVRGSSGATARGIGCGRFWVRMTLRRSSPPTCAGPLGRLAIGRAGVWPEVGECPARQRSSRRPFLARPALVTVRTGVLVAPISAPRRAPGRAARRPRRP